MKEYDSGRADSTTHYAKQDVECFVDALLESSEEIRTTQIRQRLTANHGKKMEPKLINKMFAVLAYRDHVKVKDYDPQDYHTWKIDAEIDRENLVKDLNTNIGKELPTVTSLFGEPKIRYEKGSPFKD